MSNISKVTLLKDINFASYFLSISLRGNMILFDNQYEGPYTYPEPPASWRRGQYEVILVELNFLAYFKIFCICDFFGSRPEAMDSFLMINLDIHHRT